MRKASEHHPREGDLPRPELLDAATMQLNQGWTIYFKFTCAWCGTRCQLAEANKLYEHGECCACGKETIIDVGGFTLASHPFP
jgi:hypothetical protein